MAQAGTRRMHGLSCNAELQAAGRGGAALRRASHLQLRFASHDFRLCPYGVNVLPRPPHTSRCRPPRTSCQPHGTKHGAYTRCTCPSPRQERRLVELKDQAHAKPRGRTSSTFGLGTTIILSRHPSCAHRKDRRHMERGQIRVLCSTLRTHRARSSTSANPRMTHSQNHYSTTPTSTSTSLLKPATNGSNTWIHPSWQTSSTRTMSMNRSPTKSVRCKRRALHHTEEFCSAWGHGTTKPPVGLPSARSELYGPVKRNHGHARSRTYPHALHVRRLLPRDYAVWWRVLTPPRTTTGAVWGLSPLPEGRNETAYTSVKRVG